MVPLLEICKGEVTRVHRISKRIPVEDYLRVQARFSHLLEPHREQDDLSRLQALADEKIQAYGLSTAKRRVKLEFR